MIFKLGFGDLMNFIVFFLVLNGINNRPPKGYKPSKRQSLIGFNGIYNQAKYGYNPLITKLGI
jgi:hypothetical protein